MPTVSSNAFEVTLSAVPSNIISSNSFDVVLNSPQSFVSSNSFDVVLNTQPSFVSSNAFDVVLNATGGGSLPTITDTSTPNMNGSMVINGAFTLPVVSVTYAGRSYNITATSINQITVDVPRAGRANFEDDLIVTDSNGASAAFALTLLPPAGFALVGDETTDSFTVDYASLPDLSLFAGGSLVGIDVGDQGFVETTVLVDNLGRLKGFLAEGSYAANSFYTDSSSSYDFGGEEDLIIPIIDSTPNAILMDDVPAAESDTEYFRDAEIVDLDDGAVIYPTDLQGTLLTSNDGGIVFSAGTKDYIDGQSYVRLSGTSGPDSNDQIGVLGRVNGVEFGYTITTAPTSISITTPIIVRNGSTVLGETINYTLIDIMTGDITRGSKLQEVDGSLIITGGVQYSGQQFELAIYVDGQELSLADPLVVAQ